MARIKQKASQKQVFEGLRCELRTIRDSAFRGDPRSPAGIAAGQFLILLKHFDTGILPKRETLLRFFAFVGSGAAQSREARL